ncbi:AAA family ATPase [Streptomyces marincola]|uniref:ATP-binding protein n=1 Tax=Streptomyces marincola TaxID=2878388 RepID=UPI001CF2F488|nr:AAA family ATPase [Streptomyces marincola]UCM88989.1 AAA family ATPase [Streptomyces marincola]
MFDTMIGRQHAAGVLRAEIARTTTSHGGLVLVTGEAGIGKTTLVTGAAEEARARGALVLGGSCWHAENAPGHWPWTQVVRGLRRAATAEEWAAAEDAAGADLAGWTTGGDGGGAESFALHDAVTTALVTVSQRRPVALVLEDLHWADTGSLRLLDFAARHTWFERLLLICTYRDTDVAAEDHPLHALLMPLVSRATTLALTGLAPHEVGALMARTTGAAPDAALAARVHRHTGGNPFFVEQTARLWHGGEGTGVPPGVREAVRRRLGLLPEQVVALLTRAAVLGRAFHRRVLAATAPGTGTEVDRLLAHAEAARLVARDGPDRFAFAHDLVRETLHESLDGGERRRRHAAVVRALADEPALSDLVPPADLARHARLAGDELDPAHAVELLRSAAEDAKGRMAFDESLGHMRDAFRLAEALGPRRHVLVGLDLAAELRHTGDAAGAAAAFARCAEAARALDDAELLARVALSLHDSHGVTSRGGIDRPHADLLHDAHRRLVGTPAGRPLPTGDDPATLERVVRELSIRCAVLARRTGDDDALAFSLWSLHDAIWGPGTAAEREALITELAGLARRGGNRDLQHFSTALGWVTLLERGDPAYLHQLDAFLKSAEHTGRPRYRLSAAVDRAIVAALHGRFTEAEDLHAELVELTRHAGNAQHMGAFRDHMRRGLLLAQGRFPELAEANAAGAAKPQAHPELVAGIAAAEQGDAAAALRQYETSLPVPRPRYAEALWLRFQAQTAALSGDADLIARARAELAPLTGQWAVGLFGFDIGGPWALWSALLDQAEERWDAAVAGFTEAATSADRLLARPWAVRARLGLGRSLLGRGRPGDADTARALLREAEEEAARLGLRHIEEQAATALAAPHEPRRTDEFRFDGSVWTLRYAGRTVHLPDAKGLRDLWRLIGQPGQDIAAGRLLDPAGEAPLYGGDPVLDDEAKARYRRHLEQLDDEVDRAAARGDAARAAELDRERAALLTELRTAAGLGGRTRRLGDEAERARKTVTARIRDTLRRLDTRHPELAAHLRASVSTGTMCAYRPPPDEAPRFRL